MQDAASFAVDGASWHTCPGIGGWDSVWSGGGRKTCWEGLQWWLLAVVLGVNLVFYVFVCFYAQGLWGSCSRATVHNYRKSKCVCMRVQGPAAAAAQPWDRLDTTAAIPGSTIKVQQRLAGSRHPTHEEGTSSLGVVAHVVGFGCYWQQIVPLL